MTDATLNKVDARKQSRAALLERRRLVVRLHQEGAPMMQIVRESGLNWATVKVAIERFMAGGDSSLLPSARGRKQGSGRSLTPDHEAEIRQLILQKRPCFYKFQESLWTRDAVARLIEQRFGVKLSVRGVSKYLTRWGLALPSPSKRPQERCSREVQRWMTANFADLERSAVEEEGEIYWINKPVPLVAEFWHRAIAKKDVPSDSVVGLMPAKKQSMVSAINRQGTLRWAIVDGGFNVDRQKKFVNALIKDTIGRRKKPLFLIRADRSICSGQEFTNWLNHKKAGVEIFPDLPDAI